MTREALEAAHCWERDDEVSGRPEMTEFRRRLRYHQARWREANGHPIGSQPIKGGRDARRVGSRLPLAYAQKTGANFLTAGARAAVSARTSQIEPHQTLDHQRLWADLLWSPALAVNLFADAGQKLVHAWRPDLPGTVREVRFGHSPGRLDPAYLNSLRAFDAAFVLDLADGTEGILAVDVKYHEKRKPETPKPENLTRYLEVARKSRAFAPGSLDMLARRSDLAVMWLEHLLLLSMLQHESGRWSWGRYVVVRAEGNSDFAEACSRYETLLDDRSTFMSTTIEELVRSLPQQHAAAFRSRYLALG